MNDKRVALSNMFTYAPLKKYEGLVGDTYCRAPTTYIGVEIELEQVKFIVNNVPSSFNTHDDGSLKLNGREFVTVPIPFGYLEQELIRLQKAIVPPLVSSRCSVHVHLNVRNFSLEELHKFLLLYLIFERNLFKVSGDRYKNNFCIPLHSYPETVINFLNETTGDSFRALPKWYKYFALNLSPIWGGETRQVLGTAEFRHMAGTMEVGKIIAWINLIVSLKIAALQIDKEELYELIRTMNTTSHYYWLVDYVFKGFSKALSDLPTFKKDIEQDILSTKVMLFHKEEYKEIRDNPFNILPQEVRREVLTVPVGWEQVAVQREREATIMMMDEILDDIDNEEQP